MHTSRKTFFALVLFFVTFNLGLPFRSAAAESAKTDRPNIYDESLDGSKQIVDAVATAKKENKRVLLQFGANWCGWCHKLHKLCENDKAIAEELKDNYVVALVDVNKGHNSSVVTKYKGEGLGLPFIVVLDSDGTRLTTKNTGELEEGDHHSPDKVMEFLKKWAPKHGF
jgi:thioredoxin-related protein